MNMWQILSQKTDDEKKIYKAQTRAESKLKKEKTKWRTDQRFRHTSIRSQLQLEILSLYQ